MIKLCLSITLAVVLFGSLVYQVSYEQEAPTGPVTYQLRVTSEPNILYIEGSGNYREGTAVTTGKAPEEWMDYKFVGWKVDGQWYGGNPVTLRMDRNHWAVAIYSLSNIRTVTLDVVPRIAEIVVDGKLYLPNELPLTFNWQQNSKHAVAITEFIKEGTGTRYVFDKWTDLTEEASRTVVAEQGDINLRALFKVQHYLKIISDYGKVSGSGWYEQGQTAEFGVSPTTVSGNTNSSGISYVFDNWDNGDYRNSATNFIAIEEPTTVRATWKEQVRLDLVSSIPELPVAGSGWYDKGSTAYIGVVQAEYDASSPDTKYVFDKWMSRSLNPVLIQDADQPVTSLMMNDSYELEAKWKKSYYLNVLSPYGQASGSGYYDEGTFAEISLASTEIVKEKNRARTAFGAWEVGDVTIAGSPSDPSIKVRVDKPLIVKAIWKEQYYLDVSSPHATVSGSGWYDLGTIARIGIDVPSTPPGLWVRYSFAGWSGDYQGESLTAKVIISQPKAVKAQWKEDYSPAIVNSMIMAGIGTVSAMVYKKRKKNNRKQNGEITPIALPEKVSSPHGELDTKYIEQLDDIVKRLIQKNMTQKTENAGESSHGIPDNTKELEDKTIKSGTVSRRRKKSGKGRIEHMLIHLDKVSRWFRKFNVKGIVKRVIPKNEIKKIEMADKSSDVIRQETKIPRIEKEEETESLNKNGRSLPRIGEDW